MIGCAVSLLIGSSAMLFSRYAADRSVEGQKRLTGIYPDDPVRAKRNYARMFVAVGFFFIAATLVQILMRVQTKSLLNDPGPVGIFIGLVLLNWARHLVIDRQTIIDLTTEQACEIFKTDVSEQPATFLVVLFVGVTVLLGAILISTGLLHLKG